MNSSCDECDAAACTLYYVDERTTCSRCAFYFCAHCRMPKSKHAEDLKCLYDATTYEHTVWQGS